MVTPTSAIVELGGTVAFSVTTLNGVPVTNVTFSLTPALGTIDATGLYTAPSAGITEVTNVTVTATKDAATGSATVTIKPPSTATLVDPLGDAFGVGVNVNYDIDKIATSLTSAALTITITFDPATPPALPPAGSLVGPGDLAGFIDFDTDESLITGAASANSTYCPTTPVSAIGSDLFLELFSRNLSGNYDIIDTTSLADVGDATVSIGGAVITFTIPLTDLGNDDGRLHLNSVLGDDVGSTDCTPDEGAAIGTETETGTEEHDGGAFSTLSVGGDPHLLYLDSLGLTWQTPSSTI